MGHNTFCAGPRRGWRAVGTNGLKLCFHRVIVNFLEAQRCPGLESEPGGCPRLGPEDPSRPALQHSRVAPVDRKVLSALTAPDTQLVLLKGTSKMECWWVGLRGCRGRQSCGSPPQCKGILFQEKRQADGRGAPGMTDVLDRNPGFASDQLRSSAQQKQLGRRGFAMCVCVFFFNYLVLGERLKTEGEGDSRR